MTEDSKIKRITNRAIELAKSNPCYFCSEMRYCIVKYANTCEIYQNLKEAFSVVQEVSDEGD